MRRVKEKEEPKKKETTHKMKSDQHGTKKTSEKRDHVYELLKVISSSQQEPNLVYAMPCSSKCAVQCEGNSFR